MFPAHHPPYRYPRVLRRARLARLAAIGTLAVVPAACGNGDAGEFAASPVVVSDTASADTSADTSAATDTASADTSVAASAAETAAADTSPSAPVDGSAAAATRELVVEFTYAASSSSGPVRNPYVAVWIEDTEGNLVDTVSVWFEQSGKGARYLSDLRSWYSASGGDADTATSGATRVAGTYSVVWDATDADGNPVAAGDYVVYVEAAREHGPYSIASAAITIGGDPVTVGLPDDGELTALTANLIVSAG